MIEDDTLAYVQAAATLCGLRLDELSLAAVAANARTLQALYAEFAELELPEALDPACVLRL